MSKIPAVIFYSLIGIHLLAAIIPIRAWPLTDYPMFSYPRGEFKAISRLALEDVYPDKVVTWAHSDYASVGLNDARLQGYGHDVNHPMVFEILSNKIHHSTKYAQSAPTAIRIVRVSTGPDESGQLQTNKEVLREIDFKELSR